MDDPLRKLVLIMICATPLALGACQGHVEHPGESVSDGSGSAEHPGSKPSSGDSSSEHSGDKPSGHSSEHPRS